MMKKHEVQQIMREKAQRERSLYKELEDISDKVGMLGKEVEIEGLKLKDKETIEKQMYYRRKEIEKQIEEFRRY